MRLVVLLTFVILSNCFAMCEAMERKPHTDKGPVTIIMTSEKEKEISNMRRENKDKKHSHFKKNIKRASKYWCLAPCLLTEAYCNR